MKYFVNPILKYIRIGFTVMNKIQTITRSYFKVTDSVQLQSGVTVPCISGQCSSVDIISQNGYRYKKGFWDKVLSDPCIQNLISNRDVLGMIEHPEKDEDFIKTPYDKASHVVLKTWLVDGNPFATFGLLNNKEGNEIKALIDVGHKPGVSTRGLGNFEQDQVSQYVRDSDYCFITWDIVRSPNFSDLKMEKVTDSLRANPIFKELVDMHQLKDSADIYYSKESLKISMQKAIDALIEVSKHL